MGAAIRVGGALWAAGCWEYGGAELGTMGGGLAGNLGRGSAQGSPS